MVASYGRGLNLSDFHVSGGIGLYTGANLQDRPRKVKINAEISRTGYGRGLRVNPSKAIQFYGLFGYQNSERRSCNKF